MTDNGSLKNRLTDDLEKVKQTGKLRAGRVRDIARDAFSQSMIEVRNGSTEVRTIAQETFVTIRQSWNQNVAKQPVGQPTEQLIEQPAEQPIDVVAIPTTDAIPQPQPAPVNSVFGSARTFLSHHLPQDYADLKQRVLNLDARLMSRYGDRYVTVKQRLIAVKNWYQAALSQTATTTEVPLLEQKQAEFGQTFEAVGTSVAQKEHQIKQQLKSLLRTATSKQ